MGQEDLPEKGLATHASILAWGNPRTEEPGGLQSVGSQRVGQNRVTTPFKTLYCKIKNVHFFVCLFFMYYLCEKYYKRITERYYIDDSVSWVPGLTSLNL